VILSDISSAGILMAYYLLFCLLLPTTLKIWAKAPKELVRKLQHVAYSLSIFLLLELFSVWYTAVGAAFLLVVIAYPVLLFLEKTSWYKKNLVDRKTRGGELRKQLLYVQLSFAILIYVFWGLLGVRWQYVIPVAVMAWGWGDAAAALVGKAFGRRRVIHDLIEGAKTYEGTLAMVLVSGTALFFTLLLYGGITWQVSILTAIIVAPLIGAVELFSRRGTDTITVPLSAAVLILPLVHFFSILGL
jgi:phytol kinase